MRLLADENTHGILVARLRGAGFDVEWISESAPGISDAAILDRADISTLILITNDRDFGNLIFNEGKPAPRALLYTRLPHRAARDTADRLARLIERGDIDGHIITLTKDGERRKPFPAGASNA